MVAVCRSLAQEGPGSQDVQDLVLAVSPRGLSPHVRGNLAPGPYVLEFRTPVTLPETVRR